MMLLSIELPVFSALSQAELLGDTYSKHKLDALSLDPLCRWVLAYSETITLIYM